MSWYNPIVHKLMGGLITIEKLYPEGHSIWQLPPEKRKRQMLADVQRELLVEADRLAQTKITERG